MVYGLWIMDVPKILLFVMLCPVISEMKELSIVRTSAGCVYSVYKLYFCLLFLYLYFYLIWGMPPICINLWYYQSKNEFIVLIFEPKHSKTISFILKYAVLHNLDFADKNSKIPQFVFPFDPHLTNKELHWKLHYNYSKCVKFKIVWNTNFCVQGFQTPKVSEIRKKVCGFET